MINPGDCFTCKEPRESGRTVRVLAVFPAEPNHLNKAYAAVASRGKVTTFSVDRLLDASRFQRWTPQ